eukprot:12509898-Alexandrium_andersonii.AAC.1
MPRLSTSCGWGVATAIGAPATPASAPGSLLQGASLLQVLLPIAVLLFGKDLPLSSWPSRTARLSVRSRGLWTGRPA